MDVREHDGEARSVEWKCQGYRQRITDILLGLNNELLPEDIERIGAVCLRYDFGIALQSQLHGAQSLRQFVGLVLGEGNISLEQIVVLLNDIVPAITADVAVLEDMKHFSDLIKSDQERLGLSTEQALLVGRDGVMKNLQELIYTDNKREKRTHLINVCGMTGIGKSHLIKHLALHILKEGIKPLLYVDTSGVDDISDLCALILNRAGKSTGGKAVQDSVAAVCNLISDCKDKNLVLILDDLSKVLTADTESAETTLKFLDHVINTASKKRCKIKVVVTSQQRIQTLVSQSDSTGWSQTKQHICDYTKDVYLSPLTDEESLHFLNTSLETLSAADKQLVISKCQGHPFSLKAVQNLASLSIGLTTDLPQINIGADVEAMSELLFTESFSRLASLQQNVLLAISLFEGGASLTALYQIVDPPDLTNKQFYAEVKSKFLGDFWLTIHHSAVKRRAERDIIANVHHPLVKQFLLKKTYAFEDDTAQYEAHNKRKERFILYHTKQLIQIGLACIPHNPEKNTDFTCSVTTQFMSNRANFKIMCSKSMLKRLEKPQLLFTEDGDKLRPVEDIVALFVCLFEFYDCFGSRHKHKNETTYYSMLQSTLEHLCYTTKPGKQDVTDMLLYTMYAMILTNGQDWRKLNDALKVLEIKVNLKWKNIPQDLVTFCKGIYGYCNGMLHLLAAWYKGPENHHRYGGVRKDMFSLAMNSMEQLSDVLCSAKRYISIHILLAQAEMTWYINPADVRVIRQAYDVCMSANKLAQRAIILEPVVTTELASYRLIEGDSTPKLPAAEKLYLDAAACFESVIDQYKRRKMEKSEAAAANLMSFAQMLQSWANRITNQPVITESQHAAAVEHMRRAADLFRESAAVFGMLGGSSKLSLWRSLYESGDALERLTFMTQQSIETTERNKLLAEARNYYSKAYNLMKNDYRSLNFGPDEPVLARLVNRLPVIMAQCKIEYHEINKVKETLKDIQAQAGKDSREPPRDYSGSDLATSSDQESSEDDRLTTGSSPEHCGVPDVVPRQAQLVTEMASESASGGATSVEDLGSTIKKKKL